MTGTPGVGKTTISQLLASKINAQYIGINELVKKEKLVDKLDKERKTLIVAKKKVTKKIQEILDKSEGNIIIEGHYAVDVINKEYVNNVFVLRRDPYKLRSELEKRKYSQKKVWENLAAEILDVCLWNAITTYGNDKICEIDVSGKTVKSIVEKIVLVIQNNQKCPIGIVDWLSKLDNEGKLEELIRNF